MLMLIFEFDMQYLDGKWNVLADTLSRIYKNPEKLPPFTSISSASITTNKASTSTSPSPASPTPSTLTSTSTPTSSTSTKTTKMQQFTSTTVDRSHTKCDFNLCSSRGASAGHHEDCPFDEDDLQYQLERDSSAAQALQQPSTNYQPPTVESDHGSDSDVWEQDVENNIWYKVYSQAEKIEDDDENDADSEDDDFCETLGSASMSLDDMTTTHNETSSEQSCSGCSACDLTSPQQPPPSPPTPPAPTQTISASAATVKKQQDHEHGRLHWTACYITGCRYHRNEDKAYQP